MDLVLAHNEEVGQDALRMGIDPAKLAIFETRPAQVAPPADLRHSEGPPTVLVPCSFSEDEPIEVLLDAAALAPEIRFRVTGSLTKARARGFVAKAPPNLEFTGFLSKEDYDRSLFTSDALLGLTTIEGIQLSVANEAVGAGLAMVLSDTSILRTLFGSAALFAANKPEALAETCRQAVARSTELAVRSADLRVARESRWAGQAAHVAGLARIEPNLTST
jgi:glycosyltransferase involved in cell wall biosynthesis